MTASSEGRTEAPASSAQNVFRLLLGAFLLLAGVGHLTWQRSEFLAQVPSWIPIDADMVVVLSGVVEIALGVALLVSRRYRVSLGWLTALFFILVFPGNVSQFSNSIDAFGLDSERARAIRLLFQPVLIVWALWSTGAWSAWRHRRRDESPSTTLQ